MLTVYDSSIRRWCSHCIKLMVFAVLLIIQKPVVAYSEGADPYVRVRVLRKQSVVTVRGFGLRVVGEPQLPSSPVTVPPIYALAEHKMAAEEGVSLLPTKKIWRVVRDNNQWRVYENEIQKSEYRASTIEIEGEDLRVDNLMVTGRVRLVSRSSSEMDMVVELKMEDYLLGVLPSEMPVHWPMDALKAQAVASRTYAMAVRESRVGEHFHLDSTIENQVYSWSGYSHLPTNLRTKVERAVHETAGVILVNPNKKPVWTYFHSHCGGQTEEAHRVWGVGPRMGTVTDSRCAGDRSATWQSVWTDEEILKILNRSAAPASSPLVELVQTQTTSSEPSSLRIEQVQFLAKNLAGESVTRTFSGQDFRRQFGFGKIKSTQIQLRYDSKKMVVRGHGNGHGVGMCQTGARFMAMAGQNYLAILRRYYPKSELSVPHRMSFMQTTFDASARSVE